MLLGKDEGLLVEGDPFALRLADGDDRDQYPGGRGEI